MPPLPPFASSFTVEASSTAPGEITYTAENLPDGAIFDGKTGEFTWTPDASQAGEYTIIFRGSDGVNYAEVTVKVNVVTMASTITLDNGTTTTTVNVANGQELPKVTVPTKVGFVFGGYYTGRDGSGTKYYCDDEHGTGVVTGPVGEDTTVDLYAIWLPLHITISYHSNIAGNDTTYEDVHEVDEGDTVAIDLYPSDIGWSYDGYTFLYWSEQPYPTEDILDPSVTTWYVDIDYDVYAIWRPVSADSLPISLTYNSNIPGDNETYTVTDDDYGLIRTVLNPEDQEWFYDETHAFLYWCTSPNGKGDIYYSDDEHITGWVYDTTVLYAIWGHTKEYLKQIEIFSGLTRVVAKEKLNDGLTYSVSLSKRLVR